MSKSAVSTLIESKIERVKAYFEELEQSLPKKPDGSLSLENERLRRSWKRQKESMLAACLNPQNIILLPTKYLA